jgi:hypothetical protein
MPSPVDTLIDQTVARAEAAGKPLHPELVEVLRESYKTGEMGKVLGRAQSLPASVPGQQAVTYSGTFDDNIKARELAQTYVNGNPGSYAIDNTEVGQHLSKTPNWTSALNDVNTRLRDRDLPALTPSQVFYTQEPAWRAASERFAEQAQGPMVSLVHYPAPDSAFVQNELPASLNNPRIPTINDMPVATLKQSRTPVEDISRGAQPVFERYTELKPGGGRGMVEQGAETKAPERVKPANDVAVDVMREVLRSKGLSESVVERAAEEARRRISEREKSGLGAPKVNVHDKAAPAQNKAPVQQSMAKPERPVQRPADPSPDIPPKGRGR